MDVTKVARFAMLVALLLLVNCSSPSAAPAKPPEAKPAESKSAEAKAALSESKPSPTAQTKQEPMRIKLGMVAGAQKIPIGAIDKLGLDKKYNLILEKIDYASTVAKNTALRGGEMDVTPSGWTIIAQYRIQGLKVMNVFPMFGGGYDVLTRKDSPYKDVGDLKGKKIGNFSEPTGVAPTLMRLASIKTWGFDPYKDSEMHQGAAPLLGGLVEKGELDAALIMEPQATMMLATGKFRSIGAVNDLYEKAYGERAMMVTFATTDAFAQKNPAAVTAMIRAYIDAVNHLRTNDDIWTEVARDVDITSPEAVKLLRERTRTHFLTEWDDKFIASQKRFAQKAIEIVGPDFLPYLPDDSFSTAYVPKDAK